MSIALLETATAERTRSWEALRARVRDDLAAALAEVLPAKFEVIVFGSLVREGRFSERSDVDVAISSLPPGMDRIDMTAELSSRLGREVDVVLLSQSRFAENILRTGEKWTV